jgi:hypothetical protein
LLGVSFGGSDVAVSTCDPPREQWLTGLGQVLGLFLIEAGGVSFGVVVVLLFWRGWVA